MAITFVAVTTAGDSSGTSLSVTRASTTTDDLNILDFYLEGLTGSAPTDLTFGNGTWVKIFRWPSSANTFTWYRYREKYAGAGSTCNVTWAGGANTWRTATVHAWRGVDTTTPEDA